MLEWAIGKLEGALRGLIVKRDGNFPEPGTIPGRTATKRRIYRTTRLIWIEKERGARAVNSPAEIGNSIFVPGS